MNANIFGKSQNTKLWTLKKCYEIFIAKYPTVFKKYKKSWNENKISDELVLEAEKEDLNALGFEFVREYRNLQKSNRCDIRITTASDIGLNDRKIIIECKVFSKNSKEDKYIDTKESNNREEENNPTNGIISLISNKYSELSIAGMIGFNKTGDMQKRIEKIKNLIDQREAGEDMINISNLEKYKITENFNHSYKSSHQRDSNLGNIEIYHLFFDFSQSS